MRMRTLKHVNKKWQIILDKQATSVLLTLKYCRVCDWQYRFDWSSVFSEIYFCLETWQTSSLYSPFVDVNLYLKLPSLAKKHGLFIIYCRGRQSPARGPNPAQEFPPSGLRQLSFNIKFGPENVPNDERLFSCWTWFLSRTLMVNTDCDWLSYTRWRWLTLFTLDPLVTSLVKLGHFWWSWKK